ncbi:sugar kinase [Pararhizobium sp.]|uniref:sugar kinase n=1 Tax=Pararhizobium sp. TaxID=1977563 RepID=UPI00271FE283|nr:sugar kinase [Pararhizobium sp.]MDO9414877.1 sugar kinase [Pararhizobium sp.]
MTGSVLCIGECMVELMQADGDLMRKGYAGDTFNTAFYTRNFLPESWQVFYLSALGTDAVSDDMVSFMEGNGISTRHMRRISGRMPGLYMIHLKDGERSFSYWRANSAAKLLADDPNHLRRAIDACRIIVFSGITLAILAPAAADTLLAEIARAKAEGKVVIFDPNIRPNLWDNVERMRAVISEGARSATIVMPSFEDEAAHFGDTSPAETIDRYQGLGAPNVVVKNGADGVTLNFGGKADFVPSVAVDAIVDTTSAGDSFNGAFLANYLTTGDTASAAAFAAKVASAVIGHHGALVSKDKLANVL